MGFNMADEDRALRVARPAHLDAVRPSQFGLSRGFLAGGVRGYGRHGGVPEGKRTGGAVRVSRRATGRHGPSAWRTAADELEAAGEVVEALLPGDSGTVTTRYVDHQGL